MQRDLIRQFLYDMLLARSFEQAAAEQYGQRKIGGFLHLYPGEEAVAVGTIRAAARGDYIVTTYREHVHALVRGIPANAIMAELFGRSTGCSGGYGGSMHLFDNERRFLGGYAIVGETFPIAIGAAYWLAMNGLPDVVLCFFGDGAANQGTFHESLNMAALWKLPVVFICENNHYQIGTEIHRHSAIVDIHKRACAYGIVAKRVDGMDVIAVHEAMRDALNHVRAGDGPYLLECDTYRFRGHSMADSGSYRSALEVAELRSRDPIENLKKRALGEGWIEENEIADLEAATGKVVKEAIDFAENSPPPEQLEKDIYTMPIDLYNGGAV